MMIFLKRHFICGIALSVAVSWFWRRRGWRSLYFYRAPRSRKGRGPLFDPDQELNLCCGWSFQEGGNGYTCICDDPNIHIGTRCYCPSREGKY